MGMYCDQCQETSGNIACTEHGACGKGQDLSALQDILLILVQGISTYAHQLRLRSHPTPGADLFVMDALFSMMTNVQFDEVEFAKKINTALDIRADLRDSFRNDHVIDGTGKPLSDHHLVMANWSPAGITLEDLTGHDIIVSPEDRNDDIQSLRTLLLVGVKGIAAYAHHAHTLDFTDDEIFSTMHEILSATIDDDRGKEDLTSLLLREAEIAFRVLKLLDQANTDTYGHPEPTDVSIGVGTNPGILISGHDLRDLEDLLEQTIDTGIDVYTHGEMLVAHSYPAFQGYPHFVGNYGGSWWKQQEEFRRFNGPILMTASCLVPPDAEYASRTFTTGVAGYPGIQHIPPRDSSGSKDFSPLIEMALTSPPPEQIDEGTIEVGCARETLLCSTETVLKSVLLGEISHFYVIAGCDGRHRSRDYYTDLVRSLPPRSMILTAGCAKYRFNNLDLGEVAGLPRLLDAGQCNDTYSIALVLMRLAEAVGKKDINDLPVSFNLSWFEQKAVTVLLALLHLGIRRIRLGPTLPAFLSPGIIDLLSSTFGLIPTGTVEDDLIAMSGGT